MLDAFQGSNKINYYYWIAVHIVIRNIFLALYAVNTSIRLTISAMFLIFFTATTGYIQPYKNKFVNIQELVLLINLAILYNVGVCYQNSESIFSVTSKVMITTTLLHFTTIVLYHFLTYTCHCNIMMMLLTTTKRLTALVCKKHPDRSCDVQLLNVPDRAYNYSEYREGLVSDDFNN